MNLKKYHFFVCCLLFILLLNSCKANTVKSSAAGTLVGDEAYSITPYNFVQPTGADGLKSITENFPEFAYYDNVIYYTNQPDKSEPGSVIAVSLNAESLEDAALFKSRETVDSQYQNFMFTKRDGSLCCYDLADNNAQKLVIELPTAYTVLENTLYYIKGSSAFALDIQSGKEALLEGEFINLKAENGRLWLITAKDELCEYSGGKVNSPIASSIKSPNNFTVVENTLFYTIQDESENKISICQRELGSEAELVILDNIAVFYQMVNTDGYVYAVYDPSDEGRAVVSCYDKNSSNAEFETVLYNTNDYTLKAYAGNDEASGLVCCGSSIIQAGSKNILEPEGINIVTNVYDDIAIFMFESKGNHFYFEAVQLGSPCRTIEP